MMPEKDIGLMPWINSLRSGLNFVINLSKQTSVEDYGQLKTGRY